MQKATASKIMGRYLTDTAFRGSINIYQGMTVNFFLCGVPCYCRNPLCFSVVYIYGGVLSGAGNSAAVSDLQLSSSKSGVGKPLLS